MRKNQRTDAERTTDFHIIWAWESFFDGVRLLSKLRIKRSIYWSTRSVKYLGYIVNYSRT